MNQFSNKKMKATSFHGIALVLLLVVGIFTATTTAYAPRIAYAEPTTDFVNVDISGTANPNDQPFGISCDPSAVYVTIYSQGMLAKMDPVSKNVTLIANPEGSAGGGDWYGIARDSQGNYWISEETSGRIWKYNPTGNGTWASFPVFPRLNDTAISYPLGYDKRPGFVSVQTLTGDTHGFGFPTVGHGDLIFADNAIWMGLAYNLQFDDESHAAGVSDRSFSGLLKIDPSTNSTTYYPIANSTSPTGLNIDVTDSNIMWISDFVANALYKYDISSNTLLETYFLPAQSNASGVANDEDNVYVAMKQDYFNFPDGNSEITRISKATGEQSIIDTTAPIDTLGKGTFSVYVVNGFLIWTDLSDHVGSVNLTDNSTTYINTTYANSNYFGCQEGDDFLVAGHGSVKIGVFPLSELSPVKPAPVSENQQTIKALFIDPVQAILDSCKNMTIESASTPYDYFHHGTRAWAEYMQFQSVLAAQTDPNLKNLTELQKAWLFEKVKPELDDVFWWINDA